MSRKRQYRYFICDFETTVYEGQTSTEVWASAAVELNTEDVKIFGSIDETFHYFKHLKANIICYYHNLKFDGNFWLSYLITKLHMKQATVSTGSGEYDVSWEDPEKMKDNTFQYSISDRGMWYTIRIKANGYLIEIRDSLKLLPFSVKKIGEDFKTKHQKLEMEYKGFRYAGCTITEEEKEYIRNDVLVVKEALEQMFAEGHSKLTIGSCCLAEYRRGFRKEEYKSIYPSLTEYYLDPGHDSVTVDEWVRHSYKGGWCYLVKGKENRVYHAGTTADVNSLYPSMMHSESGNRYPIGLPTFWVGNYIPDEALSDSKYYFIRVKTRFYIKEGYLPFIQIKGNLLYKGTECLESSDVVNRKTGNKSAFYVDFTGATHDTRVELTLTMTDYKLFREHYNVVDFEIIDGCYFESEVGLFDEYIDKYKDIKIKEKGAKKAIAKLFLNNLYGKMASGTDSSFKYAYEDEEVIKFVSVSENEKEAGYIPVGSAITSYARNFTIRAAQQNFHGVAAKGFIYADTDSIHSDLEPEEIKGIRVSDNDFCCWKLETCWDEAIYVRQKTYIEHVVKENLKDVEPYYNVKCAGMPDRCKDLFVLSMGNVSRETLKSCNPDFKDFLSTKRTIKDFRVGLKVPGKLMPRRIKGGVVLKDSFYEMR